MEGTEDLTFQEEHTRGSRCLEVGSAADEACMAGGTVRPALLDGTVDLGTALVGEAGGGGNDCWYSLELQGKVWEPLSTLALIQWRCLCLYCLQTNSWTMYWRYRAM